ncbi:MAG: hypothetical protein OEQ18_02160 [Gammaproteobacteria bacterium]|nr:hypothetical protein [Gammaproteobacteria bacterium]
MSKEPKAFDKIINEGNTSIYDLTLTDEEGTVIPASAISVLTLTLSNVADGAIINSRNAQDALNANNVTIHATSGLLTYTLQPLDTAIQDTTLNYETHRATFQCTYNSGAGQSNWDVDFLIRNLSGVS